MRLGNRGALFGTLYLRIGIAPLVQSHNQHAMPIAAQTPTSPLTTPVLFSIAIITMILGQPVRQH